jgi:glycosyltransferase involved in cell wall biosynthesis/organic radical activating enzyme
MHVLKIIHGYPPYYNAGSEVYSQSVCNELSKTHKVSIFSREENPYTPDFKIRHQNLNSNLNLFLINNPNGKDGYRHKQIDDNFAKLIKEIKPDIAHIGHLNHLSTGLVDELNKQNIPIIFTLHDFWLMCPRGQFLTRSIGLEDNFQLCTRQEDSKCATSCYKVYFSGRKELEQQDIDNWCNWIHHRMDETKSIIDKVKLFIAPSNYLRQRFIDEFSIPTEKIIYIDYGFPTEYLTQTEKSEEKKNYTFGYIGTHIPAKGLNLLIESFQKIKEPATLKIYGRHNGQSTSALKTLASSSRNAIEFAGEYINHNLADDVFSHVDCIVVPSIWAENSPLVIHEAQACKIPVITADFGGMKEFVQHKVNGLLFRHRDSYSLYEQMKFAIENPTLMNELGSRGYLYSLNGAVPNIKDHCKALVEIYKKSLTPKKLWRITIDTNPEDCNLNCIMCEEHSIYSDFKSNLYKETGVKNRRMKLEIIERVFSQAKKNGVKEIIPSTMGEPLLFNEIEDIYKLSQKTGIKINLTTNGTFPRKKIKDWAKLIIPNTTDVKISWNGASKETAESIMQGLNFQQAQGNLKKLIEYRDDYFAKTGYYCRITLQMTFMQSNVRELTEIIKLAARLGVDRVKGHHLWTHFKELNSLSMNSSKEGIEEWNKFVKQATEAQSLYRKSNGDKVVLDNIFPLQFDENSTFPEEYECPFLTKELWISATGEISPCCAPDVLRKTLGEFGNIETTDILDVLCSPEYLELVNSYKSNPLCRNCNMRRPICNS